MSSVKKLLCPFLCLILLLSACGTDGISVKELPDAEEIFNVDGSLFYRDNSGNIKDSDGRVLYTIADIFHWQQWDGAVQNGSDIYVAGGAGIAACNVTSGELRDCYTVTGGDVRINGRTENGILFYIESGDARIEYMLYSFAEGTVSTAFSTYDASLRYMAYSGDTVYYIADGENCDIIAVDTAAGDTETLVQNAVFLDGVRSRNVVSPTSCAVKDGCLYYVLRGRDNILFRVPVTGGEPEELIWGVSAFCFDGGRMYAAFCDYDPFESETGQCHLAYASAPYKKFTEISGTGQERTMVGTVRLIGDSIYIL